MTFSITLTDIDWRRIPLQTSEDVKNNITAFDYINDDLTIIIYVTELLVDG